jgi:low temperature requirement protein LtrA
VLHPARLPPESAPSSDGPRRVEWMELFFDLMFAVFITELARGLHGAPSIGDFAIFLGLFVPTWWAWVNMMLTINVSGYLSVRTISATLLVGTLFVGAMAAAAPEGAGQHAWVFALGNAGLRLVILPLWISRARYDHVPLWRPLVYNGVTAALWVASIWVPQPAQFVVWAIAILIEGLLLTVRSDGVAARLLNAVALDHIGERLGLFMLIVMGESVVVVVLGLSAHWTLPSAAVALFGFMAIACLAWTFLIYTTESIETGLQRLRERQDARAMRDTVMYLPYFLVVGVTMLAAGLSTAVRSPTAPLSAGSAVTLGGGLALFYLTNGVVALRYGQTPRNVMRWAVPGTVLSLLIIPLAVAVPALDSVACVLAILVANVVYAEVVRRQRLRSTAAELLG